MTVARERDISTQGAAQLLGVALPQGGHELVGIVAGRLPAPVPFMACDRLFDRRLHSRLPPQPDTPPLSAKGSAMVARQYQDAVPLLKHITAADAIALVEYVISETGLVEIAVSIETDDGRIEDQFLKLALADLKPGEDIRGLVVNLSERLYEPNDFYVHLAWFVTRPGDESLSSVDVAGPDRTRVYGVAETVRRYLAKTCPPPQPTYRFPPLRSGPFYGGGSIDAPRGRFRGSPDWWRRKRDEISVQAAGSVIGGVVLAALAAGWALFGR